MRCFVLAAFVLVASTGCTTAAPISATYSLSKDVSAQCVRHCGDLGMKLGAVVIMANYTGCVCEPEGGSAATSSGAAGAAAVRAVQESEQQRQDATTPRP